MATAPLIRYALSPTVNCHFCENSSSRGALCDNCSKELDIGAMLSAEQVFSSVMEEGDAALVDQFGRPHLLGSPTSVSRKGGEDTITVLQGTVSQQHANFFKESGEWWLEDLKSTNGSVVNTKPVKTKTKVVGGDRIFFGKVGFRFTDKVDSLPSLESVAVNAGTCQPGEGFPGLKINAQDSADREKTQPGLASIKLRLHEPTGGGGGIVEVEGQQLQLGYAQLVLVQLLVDRMVSDSHQPPIVRGFIRSSELIASLPWDTSRPEDNHLKQLVRRTRKAFAAVGVEHIIDSRARFGYRLYFVPV